MKSLIKELEIKAKDLKLKRIKRVLVIVIACLLDKRIMNNLQVIKKSTCTFRIFYSHYYSLVYHLSEYLTS